MNIEDEKYLTKELQFLSKLRDLIMEKTDEVENLSKNIEKKMIKCNNHKDEINYEIKNDLKELRV